MRVFSLIFFFFFLLLHSITAQHCQPNGITFNTQQSIDDFGMNNPGCSIIDGDVIISGSSITDLSGLIAIRKILGKCILENNSALQSLRGLDSLLKVGSLFITNNAGLTHITGLNQLDSLGKLHISNNKNLVDLKGLDALETVEYLYIRDNTSLASLKGMPSLNSHLYGMTLIGNPGLNDLRGAERLTEIDILEIGKNEYLSSLRGLQNLRMTKRSMTLYENGLTTLSGLDSYTGTEGYVEIEQNPHLIQIVGTPQWTNAEAIIITSNAVLRDLSGLRGITTLRNLQISHNGQLGTLAGLTGLATVQNNLDISSNPNLIDLKGLDNLSVIGGNLMIRANDHLTALEGLESLSKIGGDLLIRSNNRLFQLNPLKNLREIYGQLHITFNPVLEELDGLENIDPDLLLNLQLIANPSLRFCNVKSICTYLNLGKSASVEGNAAGCHNENDILERCTNTALSGTVFFDRNRDKIQGAGERGIPNIEISITPGNTDLLTDSEGRYVFYGADPGVKYTATITLPADMVLTTDSTAYHIVFSIGNPRNMHNDFGLMHRQPKHQLRAITSGDITRCGFVVPFHTTLTNEGSFLESACVDIHWDDQMKWAGATPAPTSIDSAGHTARFCVDSLYPFESFDVLYRLQLPGVQSRGDTIGVQTETFYRDSTGWVSGGKYDYQSPILCAYDPNDKTVSPYGIGDARYTLMSSPLHYRIRFQNVGDIAAENVRIEDVLDPALDPHTLKVLQASHPYRLEMSNAGEVVFYFDNIQLPDSTTDEAGSNGFITYEIAPKAGISEFTTVENTANIYFDFNPAIQTETTFNTLVHSIPIITATRSVSAADFALYPIPADEELKVEWDENQWGPNLYVEILSTEGKTVHMQPTSNGSIILNTARLSAGVYRIVLRDMTTRHTAVKTLVIQH